MMATGRRVKHRVESMRMHVRGKLLLGEPMSRHTTFGIGGPADAYFVPEDRGDLVHGLDLCRDMEIPFVVVGNGSNVLVCDAGFRGVVINTGRLTKIEVREREGDPERAEVSAESGILMSRLLNFCVEHGLSGLEFATGIPGTVGGAVIMNAGAYGACIGEVLEWMDMADFEGGERRFTRGELEFGYRTCRMPREGVVLGAGFLLARRDGQEILETIKRLLRQRGQRLPFGWQNAGSVFKNPPGDFAGRIIEELGFKGRSVGDAQVSEQHANVIVNRGSATARDVLNLMEEIRRAAREKLGVELEPEIRVVGEP